MHRLTPLKPRSIWNRPVFSWLKYQYNNIFYKNREVRPLGKPTRRYNLPKPSAHHFETSPKRPPPTPVNVTPKLKQTSLQAFEQVGLETPYLPSTDEEKTALLEQLNAKLSAQAENLQLRAFHNKNKSLVWSLARLRQHASAKDWPAVLSCLQKEMIPVSTLSLRSYIKPLSQLLSVEPTPSPVELDPSEPVFSSQDGSLQLTTGDISELNDRHRLDIGTLICPLSGSVKHWTETHQALAEVEPALKQSAFLRSTVALRPGQTLFCQTGKLKQKGFASMIQVLVPGNQTLNPVKSLASVYKATLKEAQRQKLSSVAIPYLGERMGLPPKQAASIVHLAVRSYLQRAKTPPPVPKICLVFPDSPDGEIMKERYAELLQREGNLASPQAKDSDNEKDLHYEAFRQLGIRVGTSPVELVHKTAARPQKSNDDDISPDNIEAILARTHRLFQSGPDKVEGIRQLVEKSPVKVLGASPLVARKRYPLATSSPMEDTELRLLSKLDHPNIIKIKDWETEEIQSPDGQKQVNIKLMTEAGLCSFNTFCVEDSRLPAREARKLLGDALNGLEHLHKHKITHNDLKPGNLVVMPDMRAKLIDLGSAVDFEKTKKTNNPVETTPRYKAPEIPPQSQEPVELTFEQLRKAEYWSIGCILYELMTATPFCPPEGLPKDISPEWITEKIDDIPDELAGWELSDIQKAKASLKILLALDSNKRELDTLKKFTKSKTS